MSFESRPNNKEMSYSEAISSATCDAMKLDDRIVVLGIGVQYPSGIFGTTNEAFNLFGPERVIDVPAMENALTGIAAGLATNGIKPILVHARVDFMALSLDQIINVISKWNYMFGGNGGKCSVVIRAIIGRGWGQGATHSQAFHSMLAHLPGIRVLLPFSVQDAYDMLFQSLIDNVPTVIFEHRTLYSSRAVISLGNPMPTNCNFQPIKIRKGQDITLAGFSYAVHELMLAANILESLGVKSEVIDMRTLNGENLDLLIDSVCVTRNLITHDVSWSAYGAMAEIIAKLFESGKISNAKIRRLGLAQSPAPATEYLENFFYPSPERIASEALNMLGKKANLVKSSLEIQSTDFQGPY